MKKLSKLLMVLMLTIGLAGCGGDSKDDGEAKDSKGTITVGTSAVHSLWTQRNSNDELEGFEIDMWNEIGKRTGYEVKFEIAEFSALFGMMDSGLVDTVANEITPTDERKSKYDFSAYYGFDSYLLTFNKDCDFKNIDDGIKAIADTKTAKAIVAASSNPRLILEGLITDAGYSVDSAGITYIEDATGILNQINNGEFDATLSIQAQTTAQVEELGFKNIKMIETGKGVPIAYPFNRNDDGAKKMEATSEAIGEMLKDGTIKKLSEKWFKADVTENIPEE